MHSTLGFCRAYVLAEGFAFGLHTAANKPKDTATQKKRKKKKKMRHSNANIKSVSIPTPSALVRDVTMSLERISSSPTHHSRNAEQLTSR